MLNFKKSVILFLAALTTGHYSYGISNNWEKAELATALARAPMVMIAQQYEEENSKRALAITLLQDAVRMSNELLSIHNAQNSTRNIYKIVWSTYDIAHFAKTFLKLFVPQAQPNQELYDTQTDITVQKLTEHLHNYILPFCEGAAATCIAWNNKNPQHQQYLARIEALGSLARVLSDALVSKKETLERNLTLAALVISIVVTLHEFRDLIEPTTPSEAQASAVPTIGLTAPTTQHAATRATTPSPLITQPAIVPISTPLPPPPPTTLPEVTTPVIHAPELTAPMPLPAPPIELPALPVPTSLPTVPAPMSLPLPVELPVPAEELPTRELPTRAITITTIVPAPIRAPRIGHHRRNTMEILIDENATKGIGFTTHRTRNHK